MIGFVGLAHVGRCDPIESARPENLASVRNRTERLLAGAVALNHLSSTLWVRLVDDFAGDKASD